MILIRPFRPLVFEFEGCEPCRPRLSCALACHKGNANEDQESEEVGAQTKGVANQGDSNISNTGKEANTAPTVTGNGSSVNASENIANSNITVTDDGAVDEALNALANSAQSAQANSSLTVEAALNALSQTPQQQNQSTTTTATDANGNTVSSSPIGDFLANLSTWQWLAAIAGVGGFLYLLIPKRK